MPDETVVLSEPQPMRETQIVKHARELIGTYVPNAQPLEPTFLVVTRMPTYKEGNNDGMYMGKFRGHHFILLETVNSDEERNDINGPPIPTDLGVVIHELFHQRHAEIIGAESFSDISEIPDIPDGLMVRHPIDIALGLTVTLDKSQRDMVRARHRGGTLGQAINEGFALLGELTVYDGIIKNNNPTSFLSVEDARQLKAETEQETEYHGKSLSGLHYYNGLKIARWLQEAHGENWITVITQGIDHDACNHILAGTPEYEDIMTNPALLPMRPREVASEDLQVA